VFYDFASGRLGDLTFFFPFTASKDLFLEPLPLTPEDAAPPVISQGLPTSNALFVTDPHLALPRTYQWNVGVEQALGPSQSVSATYVGALGRKLLRDDSFYRPNPNFAGVVVTRNTATSDYHALQVKFQRKLSHGLQALASYTWSHSIDISSNDSVLASTPAVVADPNVDRGDSEFDVRHSFTAAVSYDIPFPVRGKVLRAIFGDWSIDNFIVARSSPPADIKATTSIFNGTAYTSRPDLVPGQKIYLFGAECASTFQASGALAPDRSAQEEGL